ncbi:hypothetical protein E2C01_010841 [Portunus trituberculatus]|uniref:Uncharacterized protein n=1 Tax=Portunus trituberculatus TaxID=210409 RepID=A0A5B7D9H3_PORTR|nr:hypothetical protein [Portunus trituberculatus]
MKGKVCFTQELPRVGLVTCYGSLHVSLSPACGVERIRSLLPGEKDAPLETLDRYSLPLLMTKGAPDDICHGAWTSLPSTSLPQPTPCHAGWNQLMEMKR